MQQCACYIQTQPAKAAGIGAFYIVQKEVRFMQIQQSCKCMACMHDLAIFAS